MTQKVYKNFEKEVYQKYYPLVFSNCRRRLMNSNEIEDAVQSTFLIYIREEASIRSHLSSWLYWTSTNVCKVLNKEAKAERSMVKKELENPTKNDESKSNDKEETQLQLSNILEKLPKKKQEMLLMRFFDEMTYSQIAIHFKSSEDGVRKMIEHTLNQLRENLKKKDIAFSVLFMDFFNKSASSSGESTTIATHTKSFILQNTIKQQIIAQGVHNMLLFSKLKMGLMIGVCILLPITAIVGWEINRGQNVELSEIGSQNKDALNSKNSVKPIVAKEVKKETTVEPKKEMIVEPKKEGIIVPKKEISYIGIWKLKAKSANYPHQIGSTLTIKEDGAFALTTPNAKGKFTIKNEIFSFDFGGGMILPFQFKLEENNLSFDFAKGQMKMEYEKSEK